VVDKIPWRGVAANIRKGHLDALAVSATHLGSGEVRLFVQRRDGTAPRWSLGRYTQAQPARIGPKHALASAALPVIFPAVRVGGQMYCDGGLRHSLPLSPALRLGAERVIVVPLRHKAPPGRPSPVAQKPGIASAPFLVGKTLNALLLDHTDQDLDRLERINDIIQAGTEAYGASFVETLNRAMVPHRNSPVRHVRRIVVRPSQDLGKLAGDYVRSAEFKLRVKGQMVGRVIRRLAERESTPDADEADLVSYLLFDGGFADQLIQLGRSDARVLKQDWIRFFKE
jgi:NTE family protein